MRTLSVLFALAASCGEAPVARPTPAPDPVEPAAPEAPPAPVYDVHEWGLLNVTRDGGFALRAGPGRERSALPSFDTMGYGKPVLYVHVEGDVDAFDLQAQVRLDGSMAFAEFFPDAEARDEGQAIQWNAHVTRAPCAGARVYPAPDDARCQDVVDDYCESAELPSYETSDSACLRVHERDWPMLFYRGTPREGAERSLTLPLEVEIGRRGQVRVTRRGDAATIGRVWRVRRIGRGVRVSSADWPMEGATITMDRPRNTAELEDARAMVARDLAAHGLRPSEIAAFERAWSEMLFGAHTTGGGRGGLLAVSAPEEAVLYWMPPSRIEELAALRFDPPPRDVRRATLVRVDLVR